MKEEQARALIAAQFDKDGHSHAGRVRHWPLASLPYSDRIAIRALMEVPERPLREDEWRCFHCGDVFTTQACARVHFGREDGATPACQIKGAEGGLLRALREAENSAADAWAAIHSESLDVHRALASAQSRHGQALTNAEELGYERGIRDQARTVANLSRALAWHGDPVRMATTREEWQQDVDEAMRWVKDNPEEGRPSFSSFNSSVDPTRAPMGALRALRDGQEQADMEGERVKVSRQAVDEVVAWASMVLGGAA